MKINKNDFAPIEQIENDMKMIQVDALDIARTSLEDGLQHIFDQADQKELSDKEYLKEVIAGACGIALTSASLYTEHMISNTIPIAVELAYQNSVQRIEKQIED